MKLLLVCGGQSTEHAVSRMSCVNIYKNCDKSKYDIKVAGITKEGEWYDLVSTDFSSDNWLEGATKINDHFTRNGSGAICWMPCDGILYCNG